MWRGGLAALAILLAGGAAFWWGTDGGRALTAETARRLAIAASPRELGDVALEDQDGTAFSLLDYRGAPLVLEFVYTTCPDICLALGTAFERLNGAAPDAVRLLSISFDPADGKERLGWFADRYGAKSPRWRVARVVGDAAKAALMERAGVVVIPDGMGGFVHNAGLYLVDARGRLTGVLDPDDVEGALAVLEGHAS